MNRSEIFNFKRPLTALFAVLSFISLFAVSLSHAAPPSTVTLTGELSAIAVDNETHELLVVGEEPKRLYRVKLADGTFTSINLQEDSETIAVHARHRVALVADGKNVRFLDLTTNLFRSETVLFSSDVEGLAVHADLDLAVGFGEDGKSAYLIDVGARTLVKTISLSTKVEAVAIDAAARKAYVATKNSDKLIVLDLATQLIEREMALSGSPRALIVDGALSLALVAFDNRDALDLIDLRTLTRLQSVSGLPSKATALALNADTHVAVIGSEGAGQLSLFTLDTRQLTPAFAAVAKPESIDVSLRYNLAAVISDDSPVLRLVPLPNPVPVLNEIVPPDVTLPAPALTLLAIGEHFVDSSTVYLDGKALVTRWKDNQHLEADIPATALTQAAVLKVKVVTPAPAGGESQTLNFSVLNPLPVLSAVSPIQAVAGGPAVTLTVTGERFVATSAVHFGTQPLVTTYLDDRRLTAVVPAALLATAALVPVRVFNPVPGGGYSQPISFTVLQAGPAISTITPNTGEVGTLVTVLGSGFDPVATNNQVVFAGAVPATVQSATANQLRFTVPPGAQTGPIAVTTPKGSTQSPPFTVILDQDFALVASPAVATLVQGASTKLMIQLSSLGTKAFTSLVRLSAQGLPAGMTAEFSPIAITGSQTVSLTLTSSTAVAPQTVTFNITGTATLNGRVETRVLAANVTVVQGGQTGVKGRFVDTEGRGISGVYVRFETLETISDAAGNFTLLGVPVGQITLRFDATPANPLYPIWPYMLTTQANQMVVLADWVINPPPQDLNFKPLVQNSPVDQAMTDPRYPGLQFTIPAGVSIIGWDGVPKSRMAVERIEPTKLPVPPPPVPIKESYQLYFGTPMGGIPSSPIPITLPNVAELEPGEKSDIWYFDGSPMGGSGEWKHAGLGTISADGKTVTSDPGNGIPRFCGVCGLASQSCEQPKEGPTCSGSKGGGPTAGAGNPVDLYSGTQFPQVGEMSCGGAVAFDIARSYSLVDAFNNKAGTTGSLGYGWVLNYDIALLPFDGPQKRIIMPPNQRVNFTQQADGTYTNADTQSFAGAIMRLTPNGQANHWEVVFKDGRIWRFKPFPGITTRLRGQPPTFLTEQVDTSGNVLNITRTSTGHITAVGVPGRSMTMTYGANNFISQIQDSIGRTVSFTYNSANRIETVTDSSNGVTRYTYELEPPPPPSSGGGGGGGGGGGSISVPPADISCVTPKVWNRINSIQYPGRATPTENHYGSSNRVLRQTSYLGEYRFAYKLTGACVKNVNSPTPDARQTGPNVPDTDSWENYQAGWRIVGGQVVAATVTDPKGQTKSYTFNATGGVTENQDSLGNKAVRKYDANNRVIQETDALGRVTRYGYDDKGNKVFEVDPDNRLTEWDYDPKWNKVTEIRRSLDASTKVTVQRRTYHPTTGNLATSTDANNRTTSYAYNPKGQIETITDARAKVTRFAYNTLGDLVAITDPLGNTRRVTPDNAGRAIEVTDASGYSTQFTLNARDQQDIITEPTQATVRLEYDIRGNLTQVTNQNSQAIEINTYNDNDRLLTRTDGASRTERWTYDENGNVRTYTDKKNQTTTFTYDEMNRVTRLEYPDGTEIRTYDMLGRISTINDAQGTVGFQYDNLNRVTQVSTPQGTLRYGYDALDRRNRLETPQQVINYTYDNAGLLRTIVQGSETTTFDYDENSRSRSISYPNGIVATYGYDDAGQLTSLGYWRNQTVIESLTYTYDPNGNIINRVRSGGASKQESTKDALYDPLTNRLLRLNGETFQYDDNSNMVSRTNSCGITTFTWNAKNQLTQIQGFKPDCSVLSASFAYDALGRRIQRTINGETTTYLYDGLDVIAEMGSTTATYFRTDNIDEAIARYSNQSDRYFLSDLLGSTQVLADRQGNVSTTYSYSPFGETQQAGQASENPAQYTGRENDGTGLYYYRARYYAPDLARFIANDPIGIEGGLNTYAYALNNPLKFTDPYGLDVTVCYYPSFPTHTGFGLPGESGTQGFYPEKHRDPIGPGKVKPDEKEPGQQCKTIPATPKQDECMKNCRERWVELKISYNGLTRQCTTFVRVCLSVCGLPSGQPITPFPKPWFDSL